jgi:ParB family chromosome partitioning protein
MPRSSGLGKGLSSIIPTAELQRESATDAGEAPFMADIEVASIRPNPNQPRVHFDEQSLLELSSSIAEMGVLQPILVRPVDGGTFELIAGERRWRAAQRAGLTTIPGIVRTTDDLSSIEQALVENLHRQDLTPLEEAAAYQQLIEDFQLTHEQLSSRVGKSRSAITNTIRLLGLPPAVQHLLADGQLSAGHARALLGTPDRELQERLARQAVDHGWSVRAIEQAVRDGGLEPTVAPGSDTEQGSGAAPSTGTSIDGAGLTPHTRLRPAGLLELEGLLAAHLETRVAVQMSAKRGRVTIDFADLEDLERIFHRMVP